jgi:hypothetical protein
VFAEPPDRQPGHERIHVLRQRLRRGADRARLVRVDVELQRGDGVVPVYERGPFDVEADSVFSGRSARTSSWKPWWARDGARPAEEGGFVAT